MAQATAHGHTEHGGGHHPPTSLGLNSRKLGLWAFISSEVMFFAALITVYLVMKPKNIERGGPPPHEYFDLLLVSALAFILLLSSVTMVLAHAAAERNDQRGIRRWLGATILLGLTFLGGQVYEFNKMFGEEFVTIEVRENNIVTERVGVVDHHHGEVEAAVAELQAQYPNATVAPGSPQPTTWQTSVFGSTFFTLTGFHGTHVGIGVIWLAIVFVMALRGHISSKNALTVEMAGLYWHFVDLVWVAIFVLIYLI